MSEEKVLDPFTKEEEIEFQTTVMGFIDRNLRPALVMDGGDITIHNFNKLTNNKYEIVVELVGACSTCPSASMTMKMGVERMLLQNFDRIEMITQTKSGI